MILRQRPFDAEQIAVTPYPTSPSDMMPAILPLMVPLFSYSLVPARYSLSIVSRSVRIDTVDYIVMKKPATPINMAAQDPIRTVEAAPV